MQTTALSIPTPLGRYRLTASQGGVTGFQPDSSPASRLATAGETQSRRIVEAARDAFEAWFAGDCRALDGLALTPAGTPFQQRVWEALRGIPVGRTASYGEIARLVGSPRAARAVGSANHHNPIAVAIPCHRVIGSDGRLVGYAGGVDRKRWLLAHEATWAEGQAASSKSKVPSTRAEYALARSRESAEASI
jgi:methylated-DNA-[protein]-cysteine S-methyltransferase